VGNASCKALYWKESQAIRKQLDQQVYNDQIAPWLPETVIDCHVHVGLAEHCGPFSPERRKANWALEVGIEQSWDDLRDTYGALFPDRAVSPLAFGGVFQETHVERNNDYILSGVADAKNSSWGLMVTRPEWDAQVVRDGLSAGFVGIKPYPDLALPSLAEPSIYDFLPKSHLAILDEAAGVLMLHLPRAGRLADPDNIRELLEISNDYPRIKMIVAHIGRSFCLPTAKIGLPHFVESTRIRFDTSANLNSDVFRFALDTLGPDRILFGSDLPITLMRGVREHVGDKYINYTDAPYSWNRDRKLPEEEANYTYFLYEELRALVTVVEKGGFGKEAMKKIMYSNAARILPGLAG
jgi:uncharacterized protein